MPWWFWACDVLVLSAGCFAIGWHAHLFFCQRRKGCPEWQRANARTWTEALAERYPDGHERHPTPVVEVEALLDERRRAGVPSQRRDTPSAETQPSNPRRKT
jgi:hypothetical protein